MRVLLLGATGSLGRHCVQALVAHKHVVTLYVRNVPKLRTIISPALLALVDSIVEGDATDPEGIKRALVAHDIEGIIDVAGNQVLPWREHLLPKIATAVSSAAIAVGKERGRPLRAWVTSGIGIMRMPGTEYLIQDYFFKAGMIQHQETRDVIEQIPLTDLRWSLLASALMLPRKAIIGLEPLEAPLTQHLLIGAGTAPGWEDSTWLKMIPFIGETLNVLYLLLNCWTKYTEVADFLAEDLERGGEKWVGKKVATKQQDEKKGN